MTRILPPRQVSELVQLSPMQLWRLRRDRKFPEPIALGVNSKGYLANEIDEWIAARVAERDAKRADRTPAAADADDGGGAP
jgi:predicted DNA-binding transcriptional regulator AlpA